MATMMSITTIIRMRSLQRSPRTKTGAQRRRIPRTTEEAQRTRTNRMGRKSQKNPRTRVIRGPANRSKMIPMPKRIVVLKVTHKKVPHQILLNRSRTQRVQRTQLNSTKALSRTSQT
jgi:hypothetical protein